MKFWDKFFLALMPYMRRMSPTPGRGGIRLAMDDETPEATMATQMGS